MIFRYPTILVLTVAMAAVPSSAHGRLIGNTNNEKTTNEAKHVQQQLHAEQEDLHQVDRYISNLVVVQQKAEFIRNLRKARVHHKSEIERMQLMLSEIEGSQ